MTPADTSKPPTTEPKSLTRVQKFAVLLLMLGTDSAAQILKNCEEKELEAVSAEMARFNIVSQEIQTEVLREFAQVAVDAGTAVSGGADVVRATLEKAVGQFRASTIVSRFASNGLTSEVGAAPRPILDAEPRELFNLIRSEQSQTIALLASHLPTKQASEMLNLCPLELRDQVVERLATLSPTPIEVVETVFAVLSRKLAAKPTRALSRTGGLKSAAALLNALNRDMSKTVLTTIEERNPDLGKAIRQNMFTFEDVGRLEPAALQKILREVDTRDLAVSLQKGSESVKTALLSCISKRAAETVREEISFLGSVKLREIEAAQARIIETVRRLESEGEIELNAGEEAPADEIMA
jgi:flagellar motor switch protein FliG